jgi:hypothetical protein
VKVTRPHDKGDGIPVENDIGNREDASVVLIKTGILPGMA